MNQQNVSPCKDIYKPKKDLESVQINTSLLCQQSPDLKRFLVWLVGNLEVVILSQQQVKAKQTEK